MSATDVPNVALVAHDGKKAEMLVLAREHQSLLSQCRVVATATTGTMLSDELGLIVERCASGPQGGDLQIGAKIVDGSIDLLVFLRDPLEAHPHDPDIQALMKVCDVHEVPLATNRATARILLHALTRRKGSASHPSVFSDRNLPRRLLDRSEHASETR